MDFADEKKGPSRYDAMLADFASQIDNLPDDGEDEEEEPVPVVHVSKNVGKSGQQGPSGMGGASVKKAADIGDDLESMVKGMKKGHGEEDSDEEVKIDRTQNNQKKNPGANAEDLEAMINNLDDDGEGDDEPVKPMPSKAKPSKPINTSQNTQQRVSMQKSTQNESQEPFPISCFVGINPEVSNKLEDRIHPLAAMFSFKVMDYEIKNILEPCIKNTKIDQAIREKLGKKKITVEQQRKRFEENLQSGKLNAKTFPTIMEKSLQDNKGFLDQLTKANARKPDIQRVQMRIKILQDDIAAWKSKLEGISTSTNTKRPSKPDVGTSQRNDKPLSEYSKEVNEKAFFKESQRLNKNEQLRLLKARKAQYYNIAMYLNKEVVPSLPKPEAEKVKAKIKERHLALIQKANEVIKALEQGDDDDASEFLAQEMTEAGSEDFNGMSIAERAQAIKDIISKIETAKADEANYSQQLTNSLEKAGHAIQAKVRDAKKKIEDYDKMAENMYKLEKEPWIYIPRFSYGSEIRTAQMVNPDIPDNNILVVEFPCVRKCSQKWYFLKYSLQANGKVQQFDTKSCTTDGIWNYTNKITLTSDPKTPDREIHMKEIHVLFYGQGYIFQTKKGENTISLKDFQRTNTIRGKVIMNQKTDRYEVEYVLRIREPLMKSAKIPVSSVIPEKIYPKCDVNAKLPEQPKSQPDSTAVSQIKPQQPTVQDSQKVQPQPQQPAQQEPKKQEGGFPLVITKTAMASIKGVDASELPAGITIEYATEPDDPAKNKSYTYLQALSSQLETAKGQMMGGFGSVADSKYVRDKWSIAFKELNMLEAKLNAGNIDQDEYLKDLQDTIERDKKLLEFYAAKGIGFYVNFIKAKLAIYKKEISDMTGEEQPQEEQPQEEAKEQPKEEEQPQPEQPQQEEPVLQKPQQQEALPGFPLVLTKTAMASMKGVDASELPAGVALEDATEPDNPVKNKSYTYLQELSKQLESAKGQMMGGFGSVADSKYVRDKWSLAYKEFNMLEAKLQAGGIDMEEYLKDLEGTFERDKKLLEFYTAKGIGFYVNFIKAKLAIYEKEVSEMKQQMQEEQPQE